MNTETSTDTALSSDEIEALVEHAESSELMMGYIELMTSVAVSHLRFQSGVSSMCFVKSRPRRCSRF